MRSLLFNASNMEAFPVYPYAFVQVPAVARRAGVEVICQDLLGIPQEGWAQAVEALIGQHDPALILVTLRNTDSMVLQDYEGDDVRVYFPIEQTRALITTIRAVSDLKIALGGYGFSLLCHELMHYLRPDLGVFGAGDAFFAHFEDIRAGRLEGVPNLLFFQGEQLVSNWRRFDPPLAEAEYTLRAIEQMMAFYDAFPSPGFEGAPVEIMRGCCHTCVFCSEPHVAGRRVRYRDLSAVMADIEMLATHGVTEIYMISSELNPEGNRFVLDLADRIWAFNQGRAEDRRVTWFGANYLLTFSGDEYERLHRSGFTGGWFDVTALDDENARAMGTPYRNVRLLPHLKAYVQSEGARIESLPAKGTAQAAGAGGGQEKSLHWSMFLGNPATTPKTIRSTLRIANREGLAQRFKSCHVIKSTRMFDYERPDEATLAVTFSLTPDLARTGYRQMLPSFAYAPALLRAFGSEQEVARMFDYVRKTYLSTAYRRSRNWLGFIRQHASLASMERWRADLAAAKAMQVDLAVEGRTSETLAQLFSADEGDKEGEARGRLAEQIVAKLLSAGLEAFAGLFDALGLPATVDELARLTPYELAAVVYSRWNTEEELTDALAAQANPPLSGSLPGFYRFCVLATLYSLNVRIEPGYRELFVGDVP